MCPAAGGQYVSAAAHMGAALQGHIKGCGETGRRGNRRSAAGGGRSEPVSRKCPDWRPRQWMGIGWHDGGQSPPPTEAWLGMRRRRAGENPAPTQDKMIFVKMSFRGAKRRGNPFSPCGGGAAWGYYGLPHQPAGWFAMTCLLGGGVCQARQEMIFSG